MLGTARLAGIGAAKRTGELIPLAHPLALDFVDVEGAVDADAGLVRLSAEAGTTARTGVEMEAMTACAVAALTVYDMVKGLERGVSIEAVELVSKSGGRSGEWSAGRREPSGAAVITVSTSRARGEGADEGGPALAAYAERLGAEVVGPEVVADDRELIAERLRHWADEGGCELILTTGRHRLRARRRHPGGDPRRDRARGARASRRRCAPLRASTPRCGWPRAASPAPAGATLIVNFPGNPPAIEQAGRRSSGRSRTRCRCLTGERGHLHR